MGDAFLHSRRAFLAAAGMGLATIDRRALVRRHNPVLTGIDPRSPLSVGNGEFAFTADVTGLQSLPDLYEKNVPLCTLSQWGWHSFPAPDGLGPSDLRLENFDTYGRPVGYATSSKGQEKLFNWLRENPHRLNLGRIGLLFNDRPIAREYVGDIHQILDLWNGELESRFTLNGVPVRVRTCCHPTRDCVAAAIESDSRSLSVVLDFPYGSPAMSASDWTSVEKHRTILKPADDRMVTVSRQLDADSYVTRLHWTGDGRAESRGRHRILLLGSQLDFTCEFAPAALPVEPASPAETRRVSEAHWNRFWSSGAALDLSASTDKRAQELERRVVLSQYLTAIQCAGSAPPQETGLTCNSWYGKFHLEMHWWHAAHFPLWDRTPLLERSLGWYSTVLPVARQKARQQGYTGARWPKMTSLSGRDSPSAIGEMLIWQQPHPIAMAELCYRAHPNREALERYRDIVMESAEFMASFAVDRDGRYVLGPPVIPAQENHDPRRTWNPTFELAYWREALGIARQWRERLGMPPVKKWEDVRQRLSALPVKDGVYLAHENCPETFTEKNYDHPSMLAALGVLSGEGVDREIMRRTLHRVMREWRWADTWGWDFPMVAMTAARLGLPETAIEALFIESPKNTWLPNGHNWQRPSLPLYLPGNGGLLTAVALMAAKWNGFPERSWKARWEGAAKRDPQ
jgi:protein-glucosylgalactosylhydroxylysine glucosidase